MNKFGTHLIVELSDCNKLLLDDIEHIQDAMVGAAAKAGATIVGQSFHKFSPSGVTGIVAIAESHLSIHTWPEYGYAAADIFTCGTVFKPQKAAGLLIEQLGSSRPEIRELHRGPMQEPEAATAL